MLPKPTSCQGCPLYGDGRGYVPDRVTGGRVAILAQNPGVDEERGQRIVGYDGPRMPLYESCEPQPLIGSSGWMLKHTYLPLAGLDPDHVDYHNVLKCRWKHTNTLPEGVLYEQAVQHCTQAHLHLQDTVEVVVAHGRAAWEFTQGPGYPITDWRGFIGSTRYQGRPVYATLHTADLLRDPHARFIARFDWKRLGRLVHGLWPQDIPPRVIASPGTRGAFIHLLDEAVQQPEIMVDTEYIMDNQLMTHVGAAWRTGETVNGFQLEWIRGQSSSVERGTFVRYWRQLCEKTTMGFWNAKADLPILEANLHCIPSKIEDPMQAHAVLWPDMEHTYEFVASIYGRYNKLKHLAKTDILLYHWGDLIDLVWIWEALKDEFRQDPQAEQVYRQQNLKLIPIVLEAERRGLKVNHPRIASALPQYQALVEESLQLAGAYTGYPINAGSSAQLIDILSASENLKLRSVDKDVIATARAKYLPFDADQEEQQGFSSAYVMERVEAGAHPLLELRVMYAKNAKIIDDYLSPLGATDTYYHEINIHTQAGGRHSVSRLGTIPPKLLDVVMPFPGEVHLSFDWDAQEPRIQRAESGSRVLGDAFDRGIDIHTTFVCQLYGWDLPSDRRDPHHSTIDAGWRHAHAWGGKEDIRRRFAKETRYEINYGGDGSKAAQKAIRMGIEPAIAKRAAQVLLNSDPELAAWFRKVEKEVETTKISRSWGGGRRVYYWVDTPGQMKEMGRQARNLVCQRGGVDLQNLTIVEIAETVKEAQFVYGRHDSQVWAMALGDWVRVYPQIKRIATQPRLINGMWVTFPATFKIMYDTGRIEKVQDE